MPTPSILSPEPIDLTYDDVADELEQLALLEDLEPPAGPSLSELGGWLAELDVSAIAEDLERVADLEAR